MARKTKRKSRHYPRAIAFDENLEGVANVFYLSGLNLPQVLVATKGVSDHDIARELADAVFFTSDHDWLIRQPPYDHGGIVVLDTGNIALEKKVAIIAGFLYAFHVKNKALDTLRGRRFILTKTACWETPIDGERKRIW